MLSLSQIEQDLTTAMKAKNQLAVETLRGLKTRIQNEQIAKQSRGAGSGSAGKDLTEADLMSLVKSELKRRKEAAQSYEAGGRAELAKKELGEAEILEKYLPKQMSEAELGVLVDKFLSENSFTAKDFGAAMGKLKAQAGNSADGSLLAKLLKEKLK